MTVHFYVRRRRMKWLADGQHDKIAKEQTFKNDRPSEKWFRCFMKRHLELKKKYPASLALEKALLKTEVLQKFFGNWIEAVLGANPANILNMDETAIRLEGKKEKV